MPSLFLIIVISFLGHFGVAQENLINLATPDRLINAVKRSDIDAIIFYIRGGVDPNGDLEKFQRTPLMWAAVRGDIRVARLLIEWARADVNLSNSSGETALTYAIVGGNIDIIRYLVEEAEANIEMILIYIYSVLLGNVSMDIIEYLISKVDIDVQDSLGATALMHAALYGDINRVRFLIEEAGANIYLQDQSGASAIIYAVDGGYKDVADYIIEIGTDGFLGFTCKTTSYYLCNQLMWFYH